MDIIESLMKLGFTRYESMLYLTLCKEGELTGYEASKISGISRSNVYLALAGLVEKGGAYSIEGDAIKYIPVPIREFTANKRRQTDIILKFLIESIPEREAASDPYITISGRNHIMNKMKNIINLASERVYASMSVTELAHIEKELKDAAARGLKVVVITSELLNTEGIVYYLNEKRPGQIRVIADTSYVLTGEIDFSSTSTCLYSRNRNLVELIKDSLTNEIKLIQIQNKAK